MSKAIMVKDDTYFLIKAYALKRDDSLSGTVEQAVKFSIETANMQGKNLGSGNDADNRLMMLYNKTFVEKPVSDLELFKKKIIDFINKSEMGSDGEFFKALSKMISVGKESASSEFKGKITNFVASL